MIGISLGVHKMLENPKTPSRLTAGFRDGFNREKAIQYLAIAEVTQEMKDIKLAEEYAKIALENAKQLGLQKYIKEDEQLLAKIQLLKSDKDVNIEAK